LQFDGVADQLVITEPGTTTPALLPALTNNFTVEAWVNPTVAHEIDPQRPDGVDGVSNQHYLLFPTTGYDKFGSGHAGMGISVGTNGVSVYEHAGAYMPALLVWRGTISSWTHLAVVYRDRTPSLYIDGELKATGLKSTKDYVHPSLVFGGDVYGYFQGQAAELRIWQEARSAASIQQQYNKELSCPEAALVGYWQLNETAGLVTNDATAGRRLGKLTRGKIWTGAGWSSTDFVEAPSGPGPQWVGPAMIPLTSDLSYAWSPATGLDQTTGAMVNASPLVTTTYTVTATDVCGQQATGQVIVTVNAPASLQPSTTPVAPNLNWTLERSFDGNGNVVAESKQFTDGLGRPTQAQSRNAATQQVFASQTIYSSGGQPVLQTLAAPITNQNFSYQQGFITANGVEYGPAQFENLKPTNAPVPVDATQKGTLGYYFSALNEQEPLTPVTSYPYSLIELSAGPLGGTRRASAPGDELRMGKGRESRGREFTLRKEFDDYLRLRPQFVPGSQLTTLEYQGTKSVSINADGRESIVVTNKEGQALVSCLSGAQYPALTVAGVISTEAKNRFENNAPSYQDIHIPAAGSQDITLRMGYEYTAGGRVRITNLLTDDTISYAITSTRSGVDLERHVTLEPGFYRLLSVTGGTQLFSYEAHYGNFSYTYYDEAGRAIATIAPNGLANGLAPAQPTFVTRNTYDTSSRLLATESKDEGRSEYVYAQDGRIRFSQSAIQRSTGHFSYSNYDDIGRVVESGEYTSVPWDASQATVCGLAGERQELVITVPTGQTFTGIQSATYGVGSGPNCTYYKFETGCSADVTTQVRAALASQIQAGATTLRLAVTNTLLGDPCGGATKILRVVATCTGPAQPLPTPLATLVPSTLPPAGQRLVCGLQAEGPRSLLLQAPAGTVFKQIQSATFGAGSGVDCASFTFQTGCSTDVTAKVQALVASQLTAAPSDLSIPATVAALGDPCGGIGKVLRVVAVYEAAPATTTTDLVVFENHLTAVPSPASTLQPLLLEDRTPAGGLDASRCHQRNQVWYDLPWDGTSGSQGNDSQLNGRTQEFVVGAVAKTRNDNVTTWYSYDELGRVTWVVQDIVGVGIKTLDYQYDFSGNVLEVAYQKGQPDSFYHYYAYDAAQRLSTVSTSADGTARKLQAEYSYYLHGPLKRVQIAGDLQGVDYAYTIQGALKSINHVNQSLEPGHDSPGTNGVYKDLFALTLDYFRGDYRSRSLNTAPPTAGGPSAPTRYDGTIQGATWRTAASPDLHRVTYTYDEKSQLQDAQHGQWQWQQNSKSYLLNAASTATMREGGISYDPNGNIQTLQRTGQTSALTDEFRYRYKPNTNQLQAVHPAGSPNAPAILDYDYDELGQLTRQRDEQGQRYFTYDVTGKTTGVYLDAAHTQPVVAYAYDDRGFRVRQTVYPTTGAPAHVTTYVRDVAGNLLALYEQDTPTSVAQRSEVPLYGSGRLGTFMSLANGTTDYRYELTDHLGDARVIFHRPTTEVTVETMELAGVPARSAFLNNDRYRVPISGAPSGDYVARLTDSQPQGQELKRVLTVTRGDTITFSALAQWKQHATAGGTSATPYVLLGAAAGVNSLSQRGGDGQTTAYSTNSPNWLSLLAAGLGFTLGQGNQPVSLGATTLSGWLKYRVLDANGTEVASGRDYLLGTGNWEYLQTGVRVTQNGTIEVVAGTSGTGEAVYFDNLRVEQTGGLIVQEQHQYAFGAPLPGLSYSVGNRRYRYGYQGQYAEHDSLTGFESFELRLYNSRIGRWMNCDPEEQHNSLYTGMSNNPMSFIDPDGGLDFGAFVKRVAQGFNFGQAVNLNEVFVVGHRIAQTSTKPGLLAFLTTQGTQTIASGLRTIEPIHYKGDFMRDYTSGVTYKTGDILITRFFSSSNTTLSRFSIYGTNIKGYTLERGGPATTLSGHNQRIPSGEYNLINHEVSANARRFISEDRVVKFANRSVPQGRGILMHNGNTYLNTRGCVLVGTSYSIQGGEAIVGAGNSQSTLKSIVNYFDLYHKKPGILLENKAFIKDSL
jgi:RHS repeat-associated protein